MFYRMETDWIEYQCMSGQTSFLYNKVTGEHKWPHEIGQGIEYRIMYGHPIKHKQVSTTATQTDNNGCNNGCLSMYINTDATYVFNTSYVTLDEKQQQDVHNNTCTNIYMRNIAPKQQQQDAHNNTYTSTYLRNIAPNTSEVTLSEQQQDVSNKTSLYMNVDPSHFSNDLDAAALTQLKQDDSSVNNGFNSDEATSGCNDDVGIVFFNDQSNDNVNDIDKSKDFNCGNVDENTPNCIEIQERDQDIDKPVVNDDGNLTKIRHHKKRKPRHLECPVCNKVFSSKHDADRHMFIHTGVKNFECEYCTKKFVFEGDMKVHLRRHTGEKLLECSYCKRKFPKKSALVEHVRMHTNEKPFECSYCQRKFSQKGSLNKHISLHTNPKQLYKCCHCERCFKDNISLEQHMLSHTQCGYCMEKFADPIALYKHIIEHATEKPFECCYCKKHFDQKVYLDVHLKSHIEEKAFQCLVCNKKFYQKATMQKHLRIHTGEKPFECSVCSKKFARKYHLVRHSKIHRDNRL